MSTTPINDHLNRLEREVVDARARMARRDSERKTGLSRLTTAEAAVVEYMRSLGGHDPDPDTLDGLRQDVTTLRERLQTRDVTAAAPTEPGTAERGVTQVIAVELFDPEAEAAWEGAVDAHRAAVDARDTFRDENVDGLLAERIPDLAAARDRFGAAVAEMVAANAELAAGASWVRDLGTATGAWDEDDLPTLPLDDAAGSAIGVAAESVARTPNRGLMVPRTARQRP